MKQNLDYVSMSDYESDMKELGDIGYTVSAKLRKDADNWKMMVALILQTTGPVRIPVGLLHDYNPDKLEIDIQIDTQTDDRFCRMRRKK